MWHFSQIAAHRPINAALLADPRGILWDSPNSKGSSKDFEVPDSEAPDVALERDGGSPAGLAEDSVHQHGAAGDAFGSG